MLTPAEGAILEQRLSVDRLAPYRTAAGGDLLRALTLYDWNREISAALAGTLGDLEVVLRNAMHDQLTVWSTRQFSQQRWYLDPGQLLTSDARADIATARRRATRDGRPETPGRVVAELSWGFWRYLLASRYERTLWLPCLRYAFPRHRGLRRHVHDTVSGLHLVRNRIAHMEPLHNRPLRALHADALAVAGWICPVSRTWLDQRCRVRLLLAKRPLNGQGKAVQEVGRPTTDAVSPPPG